MGALYKLLFPSGKAYVGITSKTAEHRFKRHLTCSHGLDYDVSNAIKKYGKQSVQLEVLAEHDDWPTLCDMERSAIIEHNTRAPHGYNLTGGGEGITDRNEIEMARMLEAMRKPERRRLISEAGKRRFLDPRELERHAEIIRARWNDPEWRARRLVEHRKELAARNSDPVFKEKLRERMTGSNNHQAKLQEADVHSIRHRLSVGEKASDIARSFNIDPSTIYLIKTGKKWAWLQTDLLGISRTEQVEL